MSGTAESPDQASAAAATTEFDLIGATAGTLVITARVTGDAQKRWTISADGTMSWGSGAASADVTLSRSGAGTIELKSGATAQTFRVYGTTVGSKYIEIRHDGTNGRVATTSGSIDLYTTGGGDFINFYIGGALFYQANSTNFTAAGDNSRDLGGVGGAWRSIYWGTQAFAPTGSASAPSIQWPAANKDGFWQPFGGTLAIATSNSSVFAFDSTHYTPNTFVLNAAGAVGWASTADPAAGNADLFLFRDGVGQLGQRNAANAQVFGVYNTFTSSTSFERCEINWTGNVCNVWTIKGSGGGSVRALGFGINGAQRFYLDSATGSVGFTTDNSNDIGFSAANRPRTLYWGTQALAPANTQNNPPISFAADNTSGFYLVIAGNVGVAVIHQTVKVLTLGSAGIFIESTGTPITFPGGTRIDGDSSNILLLRNGANLQTLRIYGTTTGPKYVQLQHTGTAGSLTTNSGHMLIAAVAGSSVQISDVSFDVCVNAGGNSFGASQNNLTLSSAAVWQQFTATAGALSVTGIVAGLNGEVRVITNVGANAFSFTNQDGASTAANRIITGTGGTVSIGVDQSVWLIYDATVSRWRIFKNA